MHLAAQLQDDPWDELLRANVVGTYNVFEAARMAGVRRVVFASSGRVVQGAEFSPPIDALVEGRYDDLPPSWPMVTHETMRPSGTYGASKAWGEALGRHYADAHGISVLCVRIGLVSQDDKATGPRAASVYLSHRDVAQVLHRCIDAPADLRFDVLPGDVEQPVELPGPGPHAGGAGVRAGGLGGECGRGVGVTIRSGRPSPPLQLSNHVAPCGTPGSDVGRPWSRTTPGGPAPAGRSVAVVHAHPGLAAAKILD